MKTIAVINQKGGVGKTTISIHLAADLAERGNKVLVIDFDSQMNLSQGFKIPHDYSYTVLNYLEGNGDFRLKQKAENLYIMSGSLYLDSKVYDRFILKERNEQLNDMLKQNNQEFDYVVVDCQPQPLVDKKDSNNKSLPTLNELALVAADYILIPLGDDEYSIRGLDNFIPGILRIKESFNPTLSIGGVFFNKVMINKKTFKRFYKMLQESAAKEFLLDGFVRKDVMIEEAVDEGKTIFQIAPKSRAAEDMRNICKELLTKIK